MDNRQENGFDFEGKVLDLLEKHKIKGWAIGFIASVARDYCKDIAEKNENSAEADFKDILEIYFKDTKRKSHSENKPDILIKQVINDFKKFSETNSDDILQHYTERDREMAMVKRERQL